MKTARGTRQPYDRARYKWMKTSEFAAAIGTSTAYVRELIGAGWFRRDVMPPECIDVALPGSKRPEYRIHPSALARYYRERAVPRGPAPPKGAAK